MSKEKLERLRARVLAETEREREEGYDAGRAWAFDAAAAKLQRLDEAARSRTLYSTEGYPGPTAHVYQIYAAITGEQEGEFTADDAEGFWTDVLHGNGERIRNREFARGFVNGAREVWAEVKPTA